MQIKLISCKMELVTPVQASIWLKNNSHNRPLSEERVKEFCQLISSGGWNEKGSFIEVLESGLLLNGQHRLNAIVRTNIPVKMYIRTFSKID